MQSVYNSITLTSGHQLSRKFAQCVSDRYCACLRQRQAVMSSSGHAHEVEFGDEFAQLCQVMVA